MAIFHSVWTYVLSFGALGVILLLALFAPSVLPVLGEFLKPVAGALGRVASKVITFLADVVRVGVPHIFQKWEAMCLVVLLMGGVWMWSAPADTPSACKQTIADLHAKFSFKARPGAVSFHLPWWARWF